MCRFLAYYSLRADGPLAPETSPMEEFLFKASNSLVEQSRHAKLRFEPINADGFGVGWYPKHNDPEPGTFVSIEPAWSNRNLRQLAKKVYTRHFFAHVRDASIGMPVSQANCHPFQWGRFLWMHNGHLNHFERTRRSLLNSLSDNAFEFIKGNTDSEHAFALFLDQINFEAHSTTLALENALINTLQTIAKLRQTSSVDSNADLNFAVSNGSTAIFTRFASHEGHEPPSLCYLKTNDYLIISSEPLNNDKKWTMIKSNHMLTIQATGELEIKPINLNLPDQS